MLMTEGGVMKRGRFMEGFAHITSASIICEVLQRESGSTETEEASLRHKETRAAAC